MSIRGDESRSGGVSIRDRVYKEGGAPPERGDESIWGKSYFPN